jgi:hypothetical protein
VLRGGEEEPFLVTEEHEAQLQGPLTVVPLTWWITDCTFPEPGVYYVQAYFGAKLSNERLLLLSERAETGNGQARA